MKISVYKVATRRFIAFVNEYEIPIHPIANAFIYDEYLNASFATKMRVAQELKTIKEYFKSHSIDLEAVVASGNVLSAQDISRFYSNMMLRKDYFNRFKKLSFDKNVNSKRIRNAMATSVKQSNKVSTETRTGRIRTLRKYLRYLFEHFHNGTAPPEKLVIPFESMIAKLKLKENFARKTTAQPLQLLESVIPQDVYHRFREITKPQNVENPFSQSKYRNYLIVSIIDQTGLRRSEICKLKISDCQLFGSFNKINIYPNPDDHTDPRLNRPNTKSKRAHLSAISPKLMKDIQFYINHVRSKYFRSSTHDFLFVSEKNNRGTTGLPITREMVNYIFKRLSNVINFHINPHLLRHKWNEGFSEKAQAKGLDRDFTEDIRRNAMGWQPDSNMGRIYNDKYEHLIAIKLMEEHQEQIDGIKT